MPKLPPQLGVCFTAVLVACGGSTSTDGASNAAMNTGGGPSTDASTSTGSTGATTSTGGSSSDASAAGLVVLASGPFEPQAIAIAIDATNVYWTNRNFNEFGASIGGTVMKVPIGGGTPTTLASGQGALHAIAVDATSVYWTNYDFSTSTGTGTVMKVPIDGGAPTTLAAGQGFLNAITVDATSVYWTSVPPPGGPRVPRSRTTAW